jgi:hypothetical protein
VSKWLSLRSSRYQGVDVAALQESVGASSTRRNDNQVCLVMLGREAAGDRVRSCDPRRRRGMLVSDVSEAVVAPFRWVCGFGESNEWQYAGSTAVQWSAVGVRSAYVGNEGKYGDAM